MAINNTLKDIREERNLIQADLAEAIGSCSQTIGRIERGERNPSLEIAIRLCPLPESACRRYFSS